MPYDGNGRFVALPTPTFPAVSGTVIYADRWNLVINDLINGLSVAFPRDGQGAMAGNLAMGGYKITNLLAGSVSGDAVEYTQWLNSFVTPNFNKPTVDDLETSPAPDGKRIPNLNWVTNYVAPRSLRAGDTYTGAHNFSGASSVTLPTATTVGSVTAAELARLAGVTSGIQGQLDAHTAAIAARGRVAGETWAGVQDFQGATLRAVTQAQGTQDKTVATTEFAQILVNNTTAFAFSSVSTTSITIGLGAKTLTVETNKAFAVGQYLNVSAVTDPVTYRMSGVVTAYNRTTGSLSLNVNATAGSGTLNSWTVNLAAEGATAGVQVVGLNVYANTNAIPVNTVTQMTGVNSAWATTGLPLVIANRFNENYGATLRWQIETLGFGAFILQRATPLTFLNVAKGWTSTFMRKLGEGGWGPWRAVGLLPSDTMPTDNSIPYGTEGACLNRRNCFDHGAGVGLVYDMPIYPSDGDVCEWTTNQFTTNALRVTGHQFLGSYGAFGVTGNNDTVVLSSRYTLYRTIFDGNYGVWRFA